MLTRTAVALALAVLLSSCSDTSSSAGGDPGCSDAKAGENRLGDALSALTSPSADVSFADFTAAASQLRAASSEADDTSLKDATESLAASVDTLVSGASATTVTGEVPGLRSAIATAARTINDVCG